MNNHEFYVREKLDELGPLRRRQAALNAMPKRRTTVLALGRGLRELGAWLESLDRGHDVQVRRTAR